MVMGRPNKGVGHVDGCDGSELSKERTKTILQTVGGGLSVQDACTQLDIQRPRFAELRAKALQGAVDAIEPGRPGRPRTRDVEWEQERTALEARIADLERQLQFAEARAQLAQIRPQAEKGGARGKWEKRKRAR